MNRLLAGLPRRARDEVLEHCEHVDLRLGERFGEPAATGGYAYFPVTGFISMLADTDGANLDVGLIGSEGMFSPASLLGLDVSPLRGVVQGAGGALRIKTADLRRKANDWEALRRTLDSYLWVVLAELAQAAVCNQFHMVEARLARWLLMTHDRAHSDRIELTHGLLATTLGVRRSGVSVAAAALQQRKAIRYDRGEITILHRGRLKRASCECYGATAANYRRYLG